MDDNSSLKSGSLTGSIASNGTKRKRQSETKFYAVRNGHKPGVYYTYADCMEQVTGFKKALCKPISSGPRHLCVSMMLISTPTVKSFPSLHDAESFVAGDDPSRNNSSASPPTKFYAVKSGKVPGIYTDWASAQDQITGWPKPRHRRFSTRSEAQKFLDDENQSSPTTAVDATDVTGPASGSLTGFFSSSYPDTFVDITANPDIASPRAAKKAKKGANNTGNTNGWRGALKMQQPVYNEADFEPGTGPLPPGAIDGFDPNILLNPKTGELVYKTPLQRQAVKPVPGSAGSVTEPIRIYTDGSSIGNGKVGAYAGVGVYFGPRDKRFASRSLLSLLPSAFQRRISPFCHLCFWLILVDE